MEDLMINRLTNIDKTIDINMEKLNDLFQKAIYNNGEFNIITAYGLFYDIVNDYKRYNDIISEYKNVLATAEKIKYNNKGENSLQFKGLTDDILLQVYMNSNKNVSKTARILKSQYNLDYSWSGINKRLKQLNIK